MAWREAAGWLACVHAWADPRDLALRDLRLAGSYTIATMVGRGIRDMPNTYARRSTRPWEDPDAAGIMAAIQRSPARSPSRGSCSAWRTPGKTRSPALRPPRPCSTSLGRRCWTAIRLAQGHTEIA